MKETVLELVQGVLSDISGDQVNSIGDTVEAEQVAEYLKQVYVNLVTEYNLPPKRKMIQLDASGTTARPTHMTLPTTVRRLEWVRYDVREDGADPLRYEPIPYVSPEEFLARTATRTSTDATVQTVTDPSGVKLLIANNKAPSFWTSFEDYYIVFDSFDSDVDSTMQQSKTLAYGEVGPTWTMDDDFTPDLPEHLFPILKAEATARASKRHLQTVDQDAERDSRRGRIAHIKRDQRAGERPYPYPNYGRK